jgi:hypothetical protein
MKRLIAVLFLAAAVVSGLSTVKVTGQEAAEKETAANSNQFRWDGWVVRINADQSTLDARKGHITRTVHFDSNTQWTKTENGKVVKVDPKEVKEGTRVICLGKYNDKKELWATRIDLRASKSAL